MSSKGRVVIFDDDDDRRQRWKKRLETVKAFTASFKAECLRMSEFIEALKDLENRREESRTRRGGEHSDNPLDGVAVLLVDQELFPPSSDAHWTGERVAYLARCYSSCGYIVVLNQFGENPFDLSLRGSPESFADLNIGSGQIDNPGLWSERISGFRPWCWPVLPIAAERLERRAKDILGELERPLLKYLQFPETVVNTLTREALQFIEPVRHSDKGKRIPDTTSREFVCQSRYGLERKDEPMSDDLVARIAASRLSKWLETHVLPGQDILVDSPHLVTRFPSLLDSDEVTQEALDQTTSFGGVSSLGIRYHRLQKQRFQQSDWISRHAWFWPLLSDNASIEEVQNPWESQPVDYVFCEDISRFVHRDDAKPFMADIESPFSRRFVVSPDSSTWQELANDLRPVNYRPSVRFAF
jgi:hypothetical protein